MFGAFTKWLGFRKYWDTRRLVRNGEKLFDWSQADLQGKALLGPWSLNIHETALAAAPGIAFVWLTDTFFPAPLGREGSLRTTEIDRVVESIARLLQPFLVPLTFLVCSWVASWACLKHKDSTRPARRRARFAYLYYDGAYGLAPQAILALIAPVFLFLSSRYRERPEAIWLLVPFLIVGLPWITWIELRKVPSLLFDLNGYNPIPPQFLRYSKSRDPRRGPWKKYKYAMNFLAPLLCIALYLVLGVLGGIGAAVLLFVKYRLLIPMLGHR